MSNRLREAVTIRRCDNLNKENFWDIAMEICPVATSHFCEWIDRYKQSVIAGAGTARPMTWNVLFGENVKFHDLPLEMQVGIIYRFFYDAWQTCIDARNILDPSAWVEVICELFTEREAQFTK